MARVETQVSAYVSVSTKERLERFTEARGVKKARLIEDALLHHLPALRELPADIIVPPRILVDEQTARVLQERVDKPGGPPAR